MEAKKGKRKEKKRNKKNIAKVNVCVCFCFIFLCIFFIYDKIAKIKEEFNILIGSRSRIINLYVSCISNI
jgi:hypothetical protein